MCSRIPYTDMDRIIDLVDNRLHLDVTLGSAMLAYIFIENRTEFRTTQEGGRVNVRWLRRTWITRVWGLGHRATPERRHLMWRSFLSRGRHTKPLPPGQVSEHPRSPFLIPSDREGATRAGESSEPTQIIFLSYQSLACGYIISVMRYSCLPALVSHLLYNFRVRMLFL